MVAVESVRLVPVAVTVGRVWQERTIQSIHDPRLTKPLRAKPSAHRAQETSERFLTWRSSTKPPVPSIFARAVVAFQLVAGGFELHHGAER